MCFVAVPLAAGAAAAAGTAAATAGTAAAVGTAAATVGSAAAAGASSLGTWLSIGGTLVSALTAIGGGIQQNQAAKRNASIADTNARMATEKAAFDEERQRERSLRLMGASRVAAARSGVDIDGSSSLDVMADAAAQLELEALAIRHGGAVQSTAYRNQAGSDRAQGSAALVGGYGTAAARLLMGASRIGGSVGNTRPGSELNGLV